MKSLSEIRQDLTNSDSDIRRRTIFELEGFDPVETIDLLVEAIQDSNRSVREAASELILGLPPYIASKPLVPLLGSEEIKVRNIVANVLFQFGGEAVEYLIPALFDGNEDVKKFSADILGLAKSDKAVDALVEALYDECENVGISAAEALGKIGSSKAIPGLIKGFESKEYLRRECAEALGLIGDPSAEQFIDNELNNTSDPLITFALIEALGHCGTIKSIERLINIYEISMPILKKEILLAGLRIIDRAKTYDILVNINQTLFDSMFALLEADDEEHWDLFDNIIKAQEDTALLNRIAKASLNIPSKVLVSALKTSALKGQIGALFRSALYNVDDWVIYTALENLEISEDFDRDETIGHLQKLLKSNRELVIISSIQAAMRFEMAEVLPEIEALQNHENEDISEMVSDFVDMASDE